jgi:hypothetical protein
LFDYGKDKEKLLGILEIFREFFIDPSNGLIKNFDYFKNPEEYKETTSYKEFKQSIEKFIYGNNVYGKKLTSINNSGYIEASAKNDKKEAETVEILDLSNNHPGGARMTCGRSPHHDLTSAKQPAASQTTPRQSPYHSKIGGWEVKFVDKSIPQSFYIIRYNAKEIKFTLAVLNTLLGLSPKSYVNMVLKSISSNPYQKNTSGRNM